MVIEHINIGGRLVGQKQPVFIIAEAGVNHNGSLEAAFQLVDAAAKFGADAVKFQTFKAEQLVSLSAPKAEYQLQTTDANESQFAMLKKLELGFDAFEKLSDYCKQKGILFLSTPFDDESADFLDQIGIPTFKIASGELTNLPFLTRIAQKQKPIILSTGMAWMGEVETAVETILKENNQQIAILHCVSNYPADPKEVNLRSMLTLRDAFGFPVGFSDHTKGIEIPIASVALGACIVEKHFTLDRTLPGPDHLASLEPHEFQQMVESIRNVELALGSGIKRPTPSEISTAAVARKSLVAARDIRAGEILTSDCIALKRPGSGLPAIMIQYLLGRSVRQDIPKGQMLSLDLVQ